MLKKKIAAILMLFSIFIISCKEKGKHSGESNLSAFIISYSGTVFKNGKQINKRVAVK